MADKKNDRTADLKDADRPWTEDSEAEKENPGSQDDINPSLGNTSGLNVPDNSGGSKQPPEA